MVVSVDGFGDGINLREITNNSEEEIMKKFPKLIE
jgi:hypothetical protein